MSISPNAASGHDPTGDQLEDICDAKVLEIATKRRAHC